MGGKVSGTLSKWQKSPWSLIAWKGGSWEDTKIWNYMTCIVFQATEPTEYPDRQKIQWPSSFGPKCIFFFHFVYICSCLEHVCDACFVQLFCQGRNSEFCLILTDPQMSLKEAIYSFHLLIWSQDCDISTIFQTSFFSAVFLRILKHFQPTGSSKDSGSNPGVIPRKPPLEHTQEELSPHILWRNLILASFKHDLILLK